VKRRHFTLKQAIQIVLVLVLVLESNRIESIAAIEYDHEHRRRLSTSTKKHSEPLNQVREARDEEAFGPSFVAPSTY
jgi:hypothetical protein